MICVNELTDLKCNKKEIIEAFLILLSPYAPYMSEEIWCALGNSDSINNATWPKLEEKYLKQETVKYPVAFNGKMRFILELPADLSKQEIPTTTTKKIECPKSKYILNTMYKVNDGLIIIL